MITTQFEKFYEVKIWKSFINQRPDRLPHVLGQLIVSILVWTMLPLHRTKNLKRFVYYPFTFCHKKYNNNWCSRFMMGIIQLVLADWPVPIIETASVLVERKLYTCTYSYMISIFVFLLDRVNTIINSLKCYLCLHDLSYCRIHVPINQMVQRSLWFIIWGGEMVQYEHDLN